MGPAASTDKIGKIDEIVYDKQPQKRAAIRELTDVWQKGTQCDAQVEWRGCWQPAGGNEEQEVRESFVCI